MNLIAKFCDHFSVSLFLVPHMLINFCWHAACVDFRTVDEKKIFQCVICRPIPNVFVIDGIALGLYVEVSFG